MTGWLIDKSAYVRLGLAVDQQRWAERIARGLVRIGVVAALEIGFSARTGADWRQTITRPPLSAMPRMPLTPAVEERALEVQGILAGRGQHRAPSIPDLLVAALAEVLNLTVLHVDQDFDLIAAITAQPVERMELLG